MLWDPNNRVLSEISEPTEGVQFTQTDWTAETSDGYLSSGLRLQGWPGNTFTASKMWLVPENALIDEAVRKLLHRVLGAGN